MPWEPVSIIWKKVAEKVWLWNIRLMSNFFADRVMCLVSQQDPVRSSLSPSCPTSDRLAPVSSGPLRFRASISLPFPVEFALLQIYFGGTTLFRAIPALWALQEQWLALASARQSLHPFGLDPGTERRGQCRAPRP